MKSGHCEELDGLGDEDEWIGVADSRQGQWRDKRDKGQRQLIWLLAWPLHYVTSTSLLVLPSPQLGFPINRQRQPGLRPAGTLRLVSGLSCAS